MPAARTGGETEVQGCAHIFLWEIFELDIHRRVFRSILASMDSGFVVCLVVGYDDKS